MLNLGCNSDDKGAVGREGISNHYGRKIFLCIGVTGFIQCESGDWMKCNMQRHDQFYL